MYDEIDDNNTQTNTLFIFRHFSAKGRKKLLLSMMFDVCTLFALVSKKNKSKLNSSDLS